MPRRLPKAISSLVGYNPGMLRRLSLTCSLLIFLTACFPTTTTLLPTMAGITATATPSATTLPEPTPSPQTPTATITLTESSPTPQPAPMDTPSFTPLPLPTLDLPTTMTVTPIPQPSADSATIQFLSPGPLSKIISPVGIRGYAVPGYEGKTNLDLYGEDGRPLASQLLTLYTPYKWVLFYWELSFHISTVGELGRLTLSTQDEYGRLNEVNSVHLLLLSEGASIINPPDNLQERCIIDQPKAGQRLSGGILSISGKMRPYSSLPLTVELESRDGKVIGRQIVPISPAQDGSYVPFQVDISYEVSNSEWVLVAVSQLDDRISGVMYLTSQEFFLNP